VTQLERYVDHAGRSQPQLNTETKHDKQVSTDRQRLTVTYSKDRTGVPSPHYPQVDRL